MNLAISLPDSNIDGAIFAYGEVEDHGVVLIKFVQALAKRQARLDIKLAFDPANDNQPRILH